MASLAPPSTLPEDKIYIAEQLANISLRCQQRGYQEMIMEVTAPDTTTTIITNTHKTDHPQTVPPAKYKDFKAIPHPPLHTHTPHPIRPETIKTIKQMLKELGITRQQWERTGSFCLRCGAGIYNSANHHHTLFCPLLNTDTIHYCGEIASINLRLYHQARNCPFLIRKKTCHNHNDHPRSANGKNIKHRQ